jgi:hypothetical protein
MRQQMRAAHGNPRRFDGTLLALQWQRAALAATEIWLE